MFILIYMCTAYKILLYIIVIVEDQLKKSMQIYPSLCYYLNLTLEHRFLSLYNELRIGQLKKKIDVKYY